MRLILGRYRAETAGNAPELLGFFGVGGEARAGGGRPEGPDVNKDRLAGQMLGKGLKRLQNGGIPFVSRAVASLFVRPDLLHHESHRPEGHRIVKRQCRGPKF